MTNSCVRWSQYYINSGSVSVVKRVRRHTSIPLALSPSTPHEGWTITALNAAPSWNWYEDRSLGAGEGEERGWRLSWRCWAVAWASRPHGVTWHILQCAERIIVQAYLCVCPLGSGYWAALIGELGTHTAGMLHTGGGTYIYRWVCVCVCQSASIYSRCMCVSIHIHCVLFSHGETLKGQWAVVFLSKAHDLQMLSSQQTRLCLCLLYMHCTSFFFIW